MHSAIADIYKQHELLRATVAFIQGSQGRKINILAISMLPHRRAAQSPLSSTYHDIVLYYIHYDWSLRKCSGSTEAWTWTLDKHTGQLNKLG